MRAGTLAICLAMFAAVPASAASPFVARVKTPVCSHTGGLNGHGTMSAFAEFQEIGLSGTNYFRSIASAQKLKNGAWISWGTASKAKSRPFSDDALTHVWSNGWQYDFLESEVGGTYRLKLVYEFWDQKDGPDTRLAKITRYTPAC
jgi:hypothetical protein